MTLEKILSTTRSILRDEAGSEDPAKIEVLWSNEELTEYANDAVTKLCEKCHIIEDDETVSETLATGTVTIAGASGSVNSVTVNGVTVTSGAVPFNTSLTQTAVDLAANITAYTSTPNYTATSSSATVTISAVSGTGSNPNDFVVVATTTTLTATTTDMTGGNAVTRLYLLADKSEYDIDSSILHIIRARLNSQNATLAIVSKQELDESWFGWESTDSGTPRYLVPMIKQKKVRFVAPPDSADTCYLTVSRSPLTELNSLSLHSSPEIPVEYHRNMINWILHRAYMKQDAETFDINKAQIYEARFISQDVEGIKRTEIKRIDYGTVVKPMGAFT